MYITCNYKIHIIIFVKNDKTGKPGKHFFAFSCFWVFDFFSSFLVDLFRV